MVRYNFKPTLKSTAQRPRRFQMVSLVLPNALQPDDA